MLFVLAIAQVVSKVPYDANDFNCWDFASDDQAMLREYNISSHIIFGTVNCSSVRWNKTQCRTFGGLHAWLDVGGEWIETTTGAMIINRDAYHYGYIASAKSNPQRERWINAHPITITINAPQSFTYEEE